MSRQITWTPKQKEIADLIRQGKTTKEIIEAGHGRATIERVRAALKKEQKEAEDKRRQAGGGPPSNPPGTNVRTRTLDPVEVGGLLIEPADWRINQYGAFLILTTHDIAKQKYGYEGTVGEFLCDACQVLRRIMGLDVMSFEYLLKEDGNGTEPGKETNQGTRVSTESGEEPDGGTKQESLS